MLAGMAIRHGRFRQAGWGNPCGPPAGLPLPTRGIPADAAPCRTESTESPDPALAARTPPGR